MQLTGYRVLFEGNNFQRLMSAVGQVISLSLISLVIGLTLGIIIGIVRTSGNKIINFIFKIYLEVFRIVPLLVLLFVFYYILPESFNHEVDNRQVAILVFVLWISAEMSDLVRSGIKSVPQSQVDIGKSIGFSKFQLYYYVLIPQALRAILPSVINLSTRVIKTTSLLMMIGVTELMRVGTQIIENYVVSEPTASLWVYGFIFFLYFILCYPLSKLAQYVQRKAT
ncbi:amino acid ABC transporter permease [Floricoccus penangensis]|uniref:amino acid ABC transporter permease n=1 Tax=Floricoccus penangensis TaxID=1859475 RepID=UPI00203B4405|nr:amino acid ABC transporter permease [Floricoccus penangensis]URZ87503.1 amino acid ABC transporter permease [Floricoccus penangensis]